MKEFIVNKYITLKLEDGKTNIYVKEKLFRQCIRLILNIPTKNVNVYENIESIDEASEIYNKYLYQNKIVKGASARPVNTITHSITPEEEFRGHCSNIQTWVECNYNTQILHSNLAFPLLGQLTKVGDLQAKKVFKEEIAERFLSGYLPVMMYLLKRGFIGYLDKEELSGIFKELSRSKRMIDDHNTILDDARIYSRLDFFLPFLSLLASKQVSKSKEILINEIRKVFLENKIDDILHILDSDYFESFRHETIVELMNLLDLGVLPLRTLEWLVRRGFPVVQKAFKKAIIKEYLDKDISSIFEISEMGYFYFFSATEIENIFQPINYEKLDIRILKKLTDIGDFTAMKFLKDEIKKLCLVSSSNDAYKLVSEGYLNYFNEEEKESLLVKLGYEAPSKNILKNINPISKNNQNQIYS